METDNKSTANVSRDVFNKTIIHIKPRHGGADAFTVGLLEEGCVRHVEILPAKQSVFLDAKETGTVAFLASEINNALQQAVDFLENQEKDKPDE